MSFADLTTRSLTGVYAEFNEVFEMTGRSSHVEYFDVAQYRLHDQEIFIYKKRKDISPLLDMTGSAPPCQGRRVVSLYQDKEKIENETHDNAINPLPGSPSSGLNMEALNR